MQLTTLTHMGIATLAAQCARHQVPTLPNDLIWHFLPNSNGIWLRACFDHATQEASLDVMVSFTPPKAKWHVLIFHTQESRWPDILAEGLIPI